MPREPRVVIATRHASTVAWLQQAHPDLAHRAIYDPGIRPRNLEPEDTLIGSWPAGVMAAAGSYYTVEFQRPPRQAELTPLEMQEHGAYLQRWEIRRVQ